MPRDNIVNKMLAKIRNIYEEKTSCKLREINEPITYSAENTPYLAKRSAHPLIIIIIISHFAELWKQLLIGQAWDSYCSYNADHNNQSDISFCIMQRKQIKQMNSFPSEACDSIIYNQNKWLNFETRTVLCK